MAVGGRWRGGRTGHRIAHSQHPPILYFLPTPILLPQFPIPSTAAAAASLQSCLTLYDPIDGSPPGSPVPGILQAKTLEWVAISFSSV